MTNSNAWKAAVYEASRYLDTEKMQKTTLEGHKTTPLSYLLPGPTWKILSMVPDGLTADHIGILSIK